MRKLRAAREWSGWVPVLSLVAFVLLLWDAHWFARLRYAKSFVDMSFWQQVATTFVGAILALIAAWALYGHQQKASEAERRRAANREALNLLVSLHRDLERDIDLMGAVAKTKDLGGLRLNRLRTAFLEMASRRLLDLRGNAELASRMSDVLHLHQALNRSLDAHCAGVPIRRRVNHPL